MADFAKKLTVSFGAFSCTLSGFDDPFPVMSQVVDYFQQLSKSDPSFGAHPERPDTEALRVLAEKTSGLAVGAEMMGDEVVLSSVPDDIQDEFDAPKEAPTQIGTLVTVQPVQETVETAPQSPASAPVATTEENPSEADSTQTTAEPLAPETANDDITSAVSKAFEEADPADPGAATSENDDMVEEDGLAELDANLETSQNKTDDEAPVDMFAQLQIDDLDDEVFDNIDADDIYDPVTPTVEDQAPVTHDEDISAYVNEAVAFTDADISNEEDLLVETPENMPERTSDDLSTSKADPIPVWEAELVSDEPIENAQDIPTEAFEGETVDEDAEDGSLSYDDHVAAEQTALARILAATQETEDLAADNPLVALREDAAEDSEFAQDETEEPFIGEDAAATARSLVLGFGAAASLDATHDVETSTLDNRTQVSESDALAAMGMHEDENDDFGWMADDDAPQEVAEEDEKPQAAPLLLTPMQQITPVEETFEVIEQESPSSAIDMEQDDPRADLRRFADSAGAVSLPELLEASAAYSTLVNHRPSFSRGEVLDLLDEFSDEEGFSQEARIKTFGSLLRGGRIQRVENGEYEMTNDALSEYEQARKAG